MTAVDGHILIGGTGGDLVGRLHERGLRTSVLCRLEAAGRIRRPADHLALAAVPAAAPDPEWLAAARWLHERCRVHAVASFTENDQHRLAYVAAGLGVPWHEPATVERVRDKAAMRAALAAAGLDDTTWALVPDADALRRFAAERGVPLIVKPADGTASAGVSLLDDPALSAVAYATAAGPGGVLAEELLGGRQVSVECFSAGGRHRVVGSTAKYSDPATFVELGHVSPAPLDRRTAEELAAVVPAALTALGIRFGPTHTELVLTERGPRILETHLRLAGDEIPALVRDITGVDLELATVEQVLAGYPDSADLPAAAPAALASAIWYVTAAGTGTLVRVDGLAEIAAEPGVVAGEMEGRPGEPVRPPRSSRDRLGFVRARGPDPTEAVRRARAAAARVRVLVDATADPWSGTV